MDFPVIRNTRFGKLFWLNLIGFGLTAASFWLTPFFENFRWFTHLQSFLILTITLPLAGLNLTAILEKLVRITLDPLEKLAVAAGIALVGIPFLLSVEYSHFHLLAPTLPIVNALFFFLLAMWLNPFSLEKPGGFSATPSRYFWSLTSACLFYATLILVITSAYYPLPDLDPYYWFSQYRTDFALSQLTPLNGYRPLFASLAYLFNQTAGVDLYAFFKYALPALMLLVLVPATLVARQFHRFTEQFAILLLPLASASLILYFQIPIPQAMLNIALVFFIFFLLYSWMTQKSFFYFLAGAVAFGAYFYHEAAIFIFLLWLLTTLYHYRHHIKTVIRDHRLSSLLFLLIAFSYAPLLINPMYHFLSAWMEHSLDLLGSIHLNLAFPATYVNIDGNAVGWGDGIGVMKYYAFYVGPAVFLALAVLTTNLKVRSADDEYWKIVRKHKEFWILASAFLLFFIVAEILPRFMNIALLPERAWGFAGILLLAIVPLTFMHHPRRAHGLAILFIIAALINAGGAIYINSLKRYLITPEQVTSAEWIKTALPAHRVVFTYGHSRLLRIHAQTPVINVENPELYSDIRVFDDRYLKYQSDNRSLQRRTTETITDLTADLDRLHELHVDTDAERLIQRLNQIALTASTLEQTIQHKLGQAEQAEDQFYIYYAETSSRNPYANRPYMKVESVKAEGGFVYDQYPERFQRVYALPRDEVVMWKLLQ